MGMIGFGEAAQTFVGSPDWQPHVATFDKKTTLAETRDAKLSDYARFQVTGCAKLSEATESVDSVLSLVTADQALSAATEAAAHVAPNTFYFDMNSVAPAKKMAAAEKIEGASAKYIDVAIMAPVQPSALEVPLYISGPDAEAAEPKLRAMGFQKVLVAGDRIGQASSVKMIRSVMIKGIEALSAECMIAANAVGVTDRVLSSLGPEWHDRTDYNLERMLVHGHRRAAEMEEVCATLSDLEIDPIMSRGTVLRQRQLGILGEGSAPATLNEKLALIRYQPKVAAQ